MDHPQKECTDHPLKQYRSAHGLSLEAFAAKIGASKGMVSKWENGGTIPRRRYAEAIYKLTGGKVTPNDFVIRTVAPPTGAAA